MAFNYENPHDDPNLGNYDYYVNEVKDFQRKLDEYQTTVDQKLADQDADIANLQNQVNGQINGLRNEVRDFEERITEEVDSINEHTETYVNNYLTENIETILQDNPVLETKYEKVGTIQAHSTITINLTQNKMYDIMTLNYAFDMHKLLVSNDTYKFYIRPYVDRELVDVVSASEVIVPDVGRVLSSPLAVGKEPVAVPVLNAVTANINNLILTLTNNTDNVLTVYMKEII